MIPDCGCRKCLEDETEELFGIQVPIANTRFIVCQVCGNKRCPHATDHRLACTDSNAAGQPGSAYE